MKLDPSIIALKDFENINVFRLKLARHSKANNAPSTNASERPAQLARIASASLQHDAQRLKNF
jgi:hypothetical protein